MLQRAAAKWSAWAPVGAGRSGSWRRGHEERVDRAMADRQWGSFHRFVGLAGGREKEVWGRGAQRSGRRSRTERLEMKEREKLGRLTLER